jgi:hypothetical protein
MRAIIMSLKLNLVVKWKAKGNQIQWKAICEVLLIKKKKTLEKDECHKFWLNLCLKLYPEYKLQVNFMVFFWLHSSSCFFVQFVIDKLFVKLVVVENGTSTLMASEVEYQLLRLSELSQKQKNEIVAKWPNWIRS